MNAIRESVRHDIEMTYKAEERARVREEEGREGDEDQEEEEAEEERREDPVPAITRAHFEVQYDRHIYIYIDILNIDTVCIYCFLHG